MHDFCSIIININKYIYLNKNFLNNIFYRDISLNNTFHREFNGNLRKYDFKKKSLILR